MVKRKTLKNERVDTENYIVKKIVDTKTRGGGNFLAKVSYA
jgi:hypothetical protein